MKHPKLPGVNSSMVEEKLKLNLGLGSTNSHFRIQNKRGNEEMKKRKISIHFRLLMLISQQHLLSISENYVLMHSILKLHTELQSLFQHKISRC